MNQIELDLLKEKRDRFDRFDGNTEYELWFENKSNEQIIRDCCSFDQGNIK